LRRVHIKRESRILIPYCSDKACVALVFRAPGSLDEFYVSLSGIEGLIENILASTTFHEVRFVLETGPWSRTISENTGLPLLALGDLPKRLSEPLRSLKIFAHQAAVRVGKLASQLVGDSSAGPGSD